MSRSSSLSLLLSTTIALSAACSEDAPPSSQPDKDMSSSKDMTKPVDMRVPDMKVEVDMKPKGDMNLPPDLGEDMQPPIDMADMTPVDMAPEPTDMMMWPDLMEDPCTFPSIDPNCPMGKYGPGAYSTKFEIIEDTTCCRDFSGDGRPDNFVGATLIKTARTAFMTDVNNNIVRAIELGLTVYLFEFIGLGSLTYDQDVTINILTGFDTDGDLTNNTMGMGAFVVGQQSFDALGKPRSYFNKAQVFNGKLAASDGRFEITFPGLIDGVELILTDVQLKADILPTSNLSAGGGVGLGNGELSGALLRDPLVSSMNRLANSCACIGKDIFSYQATTNSYKCELASTTCESDPRCEDVGDRTLCSTLATLSRLVDIDTDGDGKRDAYSFGAKLEAVPTELRDRP